MITAFVLWVGLYCAAVVSAVVHQWPLETGLTLLFTEFIVIVWMMAQGIQDA